MRSSYQGLSYKGLSPGKRRQMCPLRSQSQLLHQGAGRHNGLRKGALVYALDLDLVMCDASSRLDFTFACPPSSYLQDYGTAKLVGPRSARHGGGTAEGAEAPWSMLDELSDVAVVEPPEVIYAEIAAETDEVSQQRFSMVPRERILNGWWVSVPRDE